MKPSFFSNTNIGNHITGIKVAAIQLSLQGYVVLETHSKSHKDKPSIMIDRPYICSESEITLSPDNNFASVDKWNCRVYWRV
jgi:hypothetical protein